MQEQLQYLSYEVFCSVELVKQLKNNVNRLPIIQSYQAIVFSETLSDEEVRNLLVFIGNEGPLLIRKFGRLPSAEEKTSLTKLEWIPGFILTNQWIYCENIWLSIW